MKRINEISERGQKMTPEIRSFGKVTQHHQINQNKFKIVKIIYSFIFSQKYSLLTFRIVNIHTITNAYNSQQNPTFGKAALLNNNIVVNFVKQ